MVKHRKKGERTTWVLPKAGLDVVNFGYVQASASVRGDGILFGFSWYHHLFYLYSTAVQGWTFNEYPAFGNTCSVVRHYMRLYFRIAIVLIIIWFGIKAIRQTFDGYDLGLFHQLQYISFGLFIIFTIAALLLDTTYYKLDKRLYQYVTSFIGLTLCGIVIFKIFQRNSVDNSETVLQVSNLPGVANVLTFEFKTNKKFRLTEYDRLGQTVYYGKYDKINDTLFLRDDNYSGYVKELPRTGTIKDDTVYWTKFDTMLIDKK